MTKLQQLAQLHDTARRNRWPWPAQAAIKWMLKREFERVRKAKRAPGTG